MKYIIIRHINGLIYYYNNKLKVWYGIVNNATKFENKKEAESASKKFKFEFDVLKTK